MEEREFSSPVCYLDFDRIPANPPKPGVQLVSSAGETGSPALKTAVPAPPRSFMDASVSSPPAAPIAAPVSRSAVACAMDSPPASNEALVDDAAKPGYYSGDPTTGEEPSRSE
jgi:hypothetical protein